MSTPDTTILHLSDFHMNTQQKDFHDDIKEFLVKNFISRKHLRTDSHKKPVDYLVLTGDFGDRGFKNNIDIANEWLKELISGSGLMLDSDQLIFCAGNHDMDISHLGDDHHDHSFCIDKGHKYIEGYTYPYDTFKEYNSFISQHLKTPKGEEKQHNKDCVRTWDLANFIVINSSRLSQMKKEKTDDIINELLKAESEIDKVDILHNRFNGYVCINNKFNNDTISSIPEDDDKKKYIKGQLCAPSFSYSENSRQQLCRHICDEIERNKADLLNENKLNFAVFHHPESHLHFLEHYPIPGNNSTGVYSKISEYADVLLCGHTHPKSDDKNTTEYSILNNFIGGACHLHFGLKLTKKKNETWTPQPLDKIPLIINNGCKHFHEKNTNRALFYYYEFNREQEIQCNRKAYGFLIPSVYNNLVDEDSSIYTHKYFFKDVNSTFKEATENEREVVEKKLEEIHLDEKGEKYKPNIPLRSRNELIPITANNYRFRETTTDENNIIKSDIQVKEIDNHLSENHISKIKNIPNVFRKYYMENINEFLNDLKFDNVQCREVDIWHSNDTSGKATHKLKSKLLHISFKDGNEQYNIFLDFFSNDNMLKPILVKSRISDHSDNVISKFSDYKYVMPGTSESKCVYIPVYIDVVSSLLPQKYINKHFDKSSERLTKIFEEDAKKNKLHNIFDFINLPAILRNGKGMPKQLAIKNIVTLGRDFITELIKKDDINEAVGISYKHTRVSDNTIDIINIPLTNN